jgi:phospholipid-binding lipoprotein MlaA
MNSLKINRNRGIQALLALLLLTLISGCSTTPRTIDGAPPETPLFTDEALQQKVASGEIVPLGGSENLDPWMGFNRSMYTFNARLDRYVLLPVVRGYEFVTPKVARTGVSNFFSNLDEIRNFINAVLQLKGEKAVHTAARFTWNSTIGVLGLIDVATPMELPKRPEDFGQTLGHYGVGPGPYLVLPLLGPSSLRDTSGLLVDTLIGTRTNPMNPVLEGHLQRQVAYYTMKVIDGRYVNKFRYYAMGSPFEYTWVRYLYGKKRQLEIAD